MKRTVIFILAASFCAFAQESGNVMYKTFGPVGAMELIDKGSAPVKGAPYSATTNNESIQTLADGNRIAQTYTGSVARDSQGRTRQDTALPPIGNLSATSLPHLVFIRDPVAGVLFIFYFIHKTAAKNTMALAGAVGAGGEIATPTMIHKNKNSGGSALPP